MKAIKIRQKVDLMRDNRGSNIAKIKMTHLFG